MPRRDDLKKILLIGSGPIIIGQACEFDYSGTQACKASRRRVRGGAGQQQPGHHHDRSEHGGSHLHRAADLGDRRQGDREGAARALLPTLGGQTALNLAMDLAKHGVLEKYGCEMIGAKPQVIAKAEEREQFKRAMEKIGLEVCQGETVRTLDDARRVLQDVGLPCVVRPSFTMGGSGSSIAYNREEFDGLVRRGLDLSPVTEVLIEEQSRCPKDAPPTVVRIEISRKNTSVGRNAE